MKRRIHVFIEGRVQGVCFRYYARERAEELGLHGWVRNMSDGRVETVAEGERDNVDSYLEWCRTGPPSAIVRHVSAADEPANGEFASFEVRHGW